MAPVSLPSATCVLCASCVDVSRPSSVCSRSRNRPSHICRMNNDLLTALYVSAVLCVGSGGLTVHYTTLLCLQCSLNSGSDKQQVLTSSNEDSRSQIIRSVINFPIFQPFADSALIDGKRTEKRTLLIYDSVVDIVVVNSTLHIWNLCSNNHQLMIKIFVIPRQLYS